jgi:PAS domain S-box-containing protein
MRGHADEAEYLKLNEGEDDSSSDPDIKESLMKFLKTRLFLLFFKLNTLKLSIAVHYFMLMIGIEGFQLLSIVLNDGSYSSLGPYGGQSPWNLTQTQWLIDVCWVFRFDRYLRTSESSLLALLAIIAFFAVTIITIGVVLAFVKGISPSISNFLIKIMKGMITVSTNLLFIPFIDTLAFSMNCTLQTNSQCMSLPTGYEYMMIFVAFTLVYVGVTAICAVLYFDLCYFCGGTMAKPHGRFKLLRLASYVAIIFCYHFINTSGSIILFLVICLVIGLILCYVFSQYLPYYNMTMCNLRLASIVCFTSAVFCMLIGQFFQSTDSSNSSVTMLFYFLTPCLVQICHLAVIKRSKTLLEKKIQHLTNPYQVEIKARLLVARLEEAKNKNLRSMYGENDEEDNQEYRTLQNETLAELETLFAEAFKKFPNAELLYLWSGIIQLHVFENYILALVQCFKGILLANKLDSQYALFHFRKTSESFYMSHMKDDAYDFELFEKAFQNAQKDDETVTRSQFYFWAELESKTPKIQKLNKLAGETSKMIGVTRNNYQRLLKLNSKNTQALRMYGWFLSSLNNYSDLGQRYLNKAEMQEEAQQKNVNANIINSLTQPLSFFDSDNAILRVSADFETIGEIQKANASACQLLGYLSAELVGRNISLIIPSPFSELHDEYIKRFHDSGKYSIIDNQQLVLYFTNKNNNIFEARLLVKVVPNADMPPYFSAIIKPTNPKYEVVLINSDWLITGFTVQCSEIFDLGSSKNTEQKVTTLISNFDDLKDSMLSPDGCDYNYDHEKYLCRLRLRLSELCLGSHSCYVLKVEVVDKKDKGGAVRADDKEPRPVSSILPVEVSGTAERKDAKPADPGSGTSKSSEEESEEISEAEHKGSASEASEDSEASEEGSESEEESESEESEASSQEKKRISMDATQVMDKAGITAEPLKKAKEQGSTSTASMENTAKAREEAKKMKDDDFEAVEGSDSDSQSGSASQSKSESESKSDSEKENESNEEMSEKSSGSDKASEQSAHNAESGEGQSASSKSMNSSMASLAQFNKSIKGLVSYEFANTKKYVLRFKITLIVTIVVLIVTSIVTYVVIDASVSGNEDLSHYVNLVGDCRHFARSMSYYSRRLHLNDYTSLNNTADRANVINWLSWDTSDMHTINLQLYQNYQVLSAQDRNIYIDEDINAYLLEGSHIREIKSNLFDATSNFILQGFLLNQEYGTSLINFANRRAFYLLRNGDGETLEYLNKSAGYYVTAAQNDLESQRLTAILLVLVSVVLLFFCAGFAIIPAIKTLEKSRREIWEIFFEIPGYVCRVMKAKCCDRLNILNEQANMELEEHNAEENEEEKKEDAGMKSDEKENARKKEAQIKKKKVAEQKKVLAYDPKQRKVMTLKLSCFFVISLVYFYLIYYTGFDVVGSILKEEPAHINWASRRKELSRGINHWVTETILENVTDFGFKFVSTSDQQIGSTYHYAYSLTDELDFVENSLIFGNPAEGLSFNDIRSSEHDSLLFTNGCVSTPNRSDSSLCPTVGNGAMSQGLHSALGTYTSLARNVLGTLAAAVQLLNDSDVVLLRQLDDMYLYDALDYSSSLYETDYRNQQVSMQVWQNVLMSIYSVFSLLIFFLVYSPMINKIGQDTKNAWSMCTLIPQEYQEDFKKLNQAIKERRDNFKWR